MSETNIALIVAFFTALSAFITALAAVCVPIRTARIEREKALKLRSVDLFFTAKVDTYKKFIEATADLIFDQNGITIKDPDKLQVIAQQACLFAEPATRHAITECVKLMFLHINDPEYVENILRAHSAALTLMQCDLDKFNFIDK